MMDLSEILDVLFGAVESWMTALIEAAPRLGFALLALILTWTVARFGVLILSKSLKRLKLRSSLIAVFSMILNVALWLFGILAALILVFPSITPAKALTTLGLGSVAIGFAFKDVFENFLAGVLLLLREPFTTGDFIECEGIEGRVERITIRDSHVRQTDNQLVVLPNALLFKNPVIVRTDMAYRRTDITVGVAYGESVDAAKNVIEQAVIAVDSVRDDVRDVQVFAKEFASSSIDFEVAWWTGSRPVDIRRSRDEVVRAIKNALDREGIEIPFPYRTLTFGEDVPLGRSSVSQASAGTASEGSDGQSAGNGSPEPERKQTT